jgi:hypothetical protein
MSLTDGKSWREVDLSRAGRLFATCFLAALVLIVVLFHSAIKDFFSPHSWWVDALAVLAAIVVPVLAYFELRHSGEANQLRREANDFRAVANRLQCRVAELEEEKTSHLGQIAANTQRPASQADRRAAILRQHLRTTVAVSESKGIGAWASPEIVEVRDDNVVALFSPHSSSSGAARCVYVHCDDLEIVEPPSGSLQLKVLKRYGDTVPLGEITKWEDRFLEKAVPKFEKGDVVAHAIFGKDGSSEKRSLSICASREGADSFQLEVSPGDPLVGNSIEISKQFMAKQIEFLAAGFVRRQFHPGNAIQHRIFIG